MKTKIIRDLINSNFHIIVEQLGDKIYNMKIINIRTKDREEITLKLTKDDVEKLIDVLINKD